MTTAGIEPATFRFVAQHLNHCGTAVPRLFELREIGNQMNSFLGVSRKVYNNNNNIYLLQLGCYPVAVVILHVNEHEIGYY